MNVIIVQCWKMKNKNSINNILHSDELKSKHNHTTIKYFESEITKMPSKDDIDVVNIASITNAICYKFGVTALSPQRK